MWHNLSEEYWDLKITQSRVNSKFRKIKKEEKKEQEKDRKTAVGTSCVIHDSLERGDAHVHKVTVLCIGLEQGRIAGDVTRFLQHTDGPEATGRGK